MAKDTETRSATSPYTPYQQGYRAGRLDRLIGIRSEYAWYSFLSYDLFTVEYGQGYRDGWNSIQKEDT